MSLEIPKGFRFATAAAAFRKAGRDDLALIVSDVPAVAAGVFTQAAFKAAPVLVAQERLAKSPTARAVLINSGSANACTGDQGMKNCRDTLALVAAACGLNAADILPASTGVIGMQFDMAKWEKAVPQLAASLGTKSPEDFTRAIMTTDAFPKFASASVRLAGGDVRLVGMAKGAGMICPNMATMLATVLCDAQVEADVWKKMLADAVEATFNRVTVDGDTSTNDTLFGLANGASGVAASGADLDTLQKALTSVLGELAYKLVQDGEGSTKVLHIIVEGAVDAADAEKVARTVAHSQLVKTAMYGRDANWGRIVAAVGRSGARFAPKDVRVSLCGVEVFREEQPTPLDFDTLLKDALAGSNIQIDIHLGAGQGAYSILASDLGHEYVDCNASYRS